MNNYIRYPQEYQLTLVRHCFLKKPNKDHKLFFLFEIISLKYGNWASPKAADISLILPFIPEPDTSSVFLIEKFLRRSTLFFNFLF